MKCPIKHLSLTVYPPYESGGCLSEYTGQGLRITGSYGATIGVQPDHDRVVTSMMNSLMPSIVHRCGKKIGKASLKKKKFRKAFPRKNIGDTVARKI